MAGGGVKMNNIRVIGGANGRTATFKIEDGVLYNSFNNGVTWNELGQVKGYDGLDGQDGTGFNPRGEWQPNTTYFNNDQNVDVVTYNGDSYYCKVSHTGGGYPSSEPIYWGLFAEGGIIKTSYDNTTTAINYTLENNKQVAFNASNISTVTFNIPSLIEQGFICEIDLSTGSTSPSFNLVNNSGKQVKKIINGIIGNNIVLKANTEYMFLIWYNGISIICSLLDL